MEAKSDTDSGSDCSPDVGNAPIRWCRCDESKAQINQISSKNTITERHNTDRTFMAQLLSTDGIHHEAGPQHVRNDTSNCEATAKATEKGNLNREATPQYTPEYTQSLDTEKSPEAAEMQSLEHESSPQPAEYVDIETAAQQSLITYSSSASPDNFEDM